VKNSEKLIADLISLRKETPLVDLTNPEVFSTNLHFVFQVIRFTEAILNKACYGSIGELFYYFERKKEEEANHAEWLRRDMKFIDQCPMTRDRFPEAMEMVGAQLYHLAVGDVVATLGYMAVLECFPMPIHIVGQLEQVHGVELLRTLRYHAEHDIDHGKDVLDMIDKYYTPAIYDNAMASQKCLNRFVLAHLVP